MKIGNYSCDISLILDEVKKHVYKTVLLQAPEGIKKHVFQVVDEIETKTKAKVMVSSDPCYGACDVPLHAAKTLGVDLVVQLGHLPVPNLKLPLPVLFVNLLADAREEESVKQAIKKLEGTKIGLVTTAQHIHKLSKVKEVLKNNGFTPVVGKGDNRVARSGQVLGCNMSTVQSISDKVDCFLFLGTGRFHPLGVALTTDKPVVSANPFTLEVLKNEIKEEKEKLLKK
ncbi:MAG TPA: diphthamide biosynthesis enzyme Dph2, partial [Thermoplasmata archaeon]|nr:diphthamide biosynthesis enzyme Dph2 [Thermoplasmata archaeon]